MNYLLLNFILKRSNSEPPIIEEISKIFYLNILKIPNRATQNKQRGRMRPAGLQFDMPGLKHVQSKTFVPFILAHSDFSKRWPLISKRAKKLALFQLLTQFLKRPFVI